MRKRTHHFKSGDKQEEYAAELAPQRIQYSEVREEQANTGLIVGYIALFLALFSIALYPIVFGSLSIIMGLLAVNYGSKTIGYTAVGFGAFSVLFSLFYPLVASMW